MDYFKSLFDKDAVSAYLDRVKRCFEICDMRTLFVTNAQLQQHLDVLAHPQQHSQEEIAYALKVRDSMVHPDTKEIIPLPFRMSAAVPMNVVIVAGMLTAASLPMSLFWQFTNQSYNTCVNYANRNASNALSTQQLLEAYGGATGAALATSFIMDKAVPKASTFRKFSPFVAVGLAAVANVVLMRRNEIVDGVDVYDEKGQHLGKSPLAGQKAIAQTSVTRVLTAFPVMIMPPAVMVGFGLQNRVGNCKPAVVGLNAALVGLGMFVFLPLTLAVFPQQMHVTAGDLEPEILAKVGGNKDARVVFNRGL